MSILVIDPGPQATLQGSPRHGLRHYGIPAAGPADPLALAIANRLAGKPTHATGIEVSYGPAVFRFTQEVRVGVAGAETVVRINEALQPPGQTLSLSAGDTLHLGAFSAGARAYIGVSGSLTAETAFGAESTYLPAGLGGHYGRALRKDDEIPLTDIFQAPLIRVPNNMRFVMSGSYALRVVPGPDFPGHEEFEPGPFRVTSRISRMGAEIEGRLPATADAAQKPSSAVMPGALQATPGGRGYLLLADGQTTGGYPHILQVIRADRHLTGQLRPNDRVQFLLRTQEEAEAALRAKQTLLARWLPDFCL